MHFRSSPLALHFRGIFEREWRPWLLVLCITLLAKGGALLSGYSIDDYHTVTDGTGALLGDVLSKGRFGHWLFLKLAHILQLEPNPARLFFVGGSLLAYAAFGLAVVRFWEVRGNGWLPLTAAALIANHPYTCEIFTFRIGLPLAAIVMALLCLLLWLTSRAKYSLGLGAAIFALALSFYPIALHFGLMVVLLGLAIRLGYVLLDRASAAPEHRRLSRLDRRLLLADRSLRLLFVILLGTFSYSLFCALFGRFLGVNAQYFGMLPFRELPARWLAAATLIAQTFGGANVLVPRLVQALFGVVVATLAVGLCALALKRPVRASTFLVATGVGILLVGAWLWSVGVMLVRREYWPVPRTMAHIGIFWAGCLVLSALTVPRPWMRRGLLLVSLPILASFIGVNEKILDDQWRLNLRDGYKAERVLARLEAQPGFGAVRRVAVVGHSAWYPIGIQATQWGDMNISAFAATWSQVSLLRETSGYSFERTLSLEEVDAARVHCAEGEPWPAAASVTIRGELAILCLSRPTTP